MEEKLIYKSLRDKGLEVRLINVISTPLPIDRIDAPKASLIRTVGMFRGARTAAVLESMGSHVINGSETILTCGDKVLTYSALLKANVPIPRSFLALGKEAAIRAYDKFGKIAVDKPPLGSWGRMVSLVRNHSMMEQIALAREIMPSSLRGHVIQEYVEVGGRDLRCLVLGGHLIGCMERIASDGWKSNVALGGKVKAIKATLLIEDLSIRAAEAVKGEFVAIDLLVNDNAFVNEVNGVPEFKGFMKATGINVAEEVTSHIREMIRA